MIPSLLYYDSIDGVVVNLLCLRSLISIRLVLLGLMEDLWMEPQIAVLVFTPLTALILFKTQVQGRWSIDFQQMCAACVFKLSRIYSVKE